MKNKYLAVAVAILCVTAFAKLVSAIGSAAILDRHDDVLRWLNMRQLMVLAALGELAVVAIVLTRKNPLEQFGAIAWISTLFVSYRFGLWWMKSQAPCTCLGTISGWVPIQPDTIDALITGSLAFLLIGSYGFFAKLWIDHRTLQASIPIPSR